MNLRSNNFCKVKKSLGNSSANPESFFPRSKAFFGFPGHPLLPAAACLAPGGLSGVLPREGLEQLQPFFFFFRTAGLRPTSATKQRPPAVKGEVDEQVCLLSPDIASKTIAVLIAKERETRTPSFATDEENDTKKSHASSNAATLQRYRIATPRIPRSLC